MFISHCCWCVSTRHCLDFLVTISRPLGGHFISIFLIEMKLVFEFKLWKYNLLLLVWEEKCTFFSISWYSNEINSCIRTDYKNKNEYYSGLYVWPNTNTNNINFFHFDRMQKYYLGSSFRPNTNIICGPLLFEYKYYLFEYEYWNYLNNTEYEYRWYWKSTNIKTEHIYFQLLVKYIWNGYAIQFASFILIRIWMIFKFSKSSKYKY